MKLNRVYMNVSSHSMLGCLVLVLMSFVAASADHKHKEKPTESTRAQLAFEKF